MPQKHQVDFPNSLKPPPKSAATCLLQHSQHFTALQPVTYIRTQNSKQNKPKTLVEPSLGTGTVPGLRDALVRKTGAFPALLSWGPMRGDTLRR